MHGRLLLFALVALPLVALHASAPPHANADTLCSVDVSCSTESMTDFLTSQHIQLASVVAVNVSTVEANGPPIRTFGNLIASINHTMDAVPAVQALGSIAASQITLVPVSMLQQGPPIIPGNPIAPALTNAMVRNAPALALLQAALGGTTVLQSGPPIAPQVTIYFIQGPPI